MQSDEKIKFSDHDEKGLSHKKLVEGAYNSKPHVVLLGAGASRAAFPNGDRSGRRLPLMNDLCECLEIDSELRKRGWVHLSHDFEKLYVEAQKAEDSDTCELLENSVDDYFSQLELPDTPTLYDRFVMSLRPNDLIISFNWDPLLFQALVRSPFERPVTSFPHGNVAIAYCACCKQSFNRGGVCPKCGRPLKISELLFPSPDKNYNRSSYIEGQIVRLKQGFEKAGILTIFGYSSPTADESAKNMMSVAWGDPNDRNIEEIEIIDIRPKSDLLSEWSRLIHTHHAHVVNDYDQSWVNRFPRRGHEAFWQAYMQIDPYYDMPPPDTSDWVKLRAFFMTLSLEEPLNM